MRNIRKVRRRVKRADASDGFTLAELIVVVTILTILAAIAIPLFLNQKTKARDAVTRSDVKNMADNISSTLAGGITTISGADGGNSDNLTIDGITQTKNGVWVYATADRQWCVSKQATSGKIFAATSASNATSGVYEAAAQCTSSSSAPTPGTNSNGTVISAAGNLLTSEQASFEAGGTTGWESCSSNTKTVAINNERGYSYEGIRAAHLVYREARDGICTTLLPLTSQTEYTATVAVYSNSDDTISLNLYQNGAPVTTIATSKAKAKDWTILTGTFTTGSATTYAIGVSDDSNNGNLWIDKIGIWSGSGGQWALPGSPIYQ